MKHFAHYIKRTIADASDRNSSSDLPYVELQSPDEGFAAPAYHSVPVNSGVASRVSIRDTIWLFSQLQSPWGRLPPSLDGMIVVADIEKRGSRYTFRAARESTWYPLFDAGELIHGLDAVNAQGVVQPLLNTPRTAVGQALQFLREIHDPSPLMRHAASLSDNQPDFISYRMKDGTRPAFDLARRILTNKRAVFWDRWSLPRRLAERREAVNASELDAHIASAIENARIVWGVISELYAAEGSYSKLEKELAVSSGKFRPYPPYNDVRTT